MIILQVGFEDKRLRTVVVTLHELPRTLGLVMPGLSSVRYLELPGCIVN